MTDPPFGASSPLFFQSTRFNHFEIEIQNRFHSIVHCSASREIIKQTINHKTKFGGNYIIFRSFGFPLCREIARWVYPI